MSYFQPLADACHRGKDVYAKDYFSQLNRVRVDIKHLGIFPDPQQWARVGETVFGHVSKWCQDYLSVPLAAIDHSSLLIYEDVKVIYAVAKECAEKGNYKECVEYLAKALYELFHRNAALRGLIVGKGSSEDAIRLSGFGVPANDYLALQEFFPGVTKGQDGVLNVKWSQSPYGHPGNWRQDAAEFCLSTFLDVALKIQHAEWIPGAIQCDVVYELKVTPKNDEAELWEWEYADQGLEESKFVGLASLLVAGKKRERKAIGVLKKDAPFVGQAFPERASGGAFYGGSGPIESLELRDSESLEVIGNVDFDTVQVTRVARKGIEEWFPWELPEIPWEHE